MSDVKLVPLVGINTVAEDAALVRGGDDPRAYVRDAVNMDITPTGKANLRAAKKRVTTTAFKNLWQSPLHGDVFGALGADWVRVFPDTWDSEVLATIGDGHVAHAVINSQVCVAARAGLFIFNGKQAQPLTLPTPPAPLVVTGEGGSLHEGRYGVAIAWLRGEMESGTSAIAFADTNEHGAMTVTMPPCFDNTVTGVRMYFTAFNGGELGRGDDYPIATTSVEIALLPERGAVPQFQNLSPMPTGKYLGYWRGRLITAKANVLRFSEPLAYHLHDERYGFVQLPQRITFMVPVDGGIWVGQVNHVVFLAGTSPSELVVQRKASRAPVPDSAIQVDADTLGADMAQGGAGGVLWLAENGYVVGAATGQMIELHAGKLSGITGAASTSVVLDKRVLTAVA